MIIEPYFSLKPWGGDFIATLFNRPVEPKIGEAYLVSTLKDGESTVAGETLSKVLGAELPFIIKIIDAADHLSIQVHPNDAWAKKLENSLGKTECWLVLDAAPGSGVYYGFKDGHSFQSMMDLIHAGENASAALNFIPVKTGDFIEVPAGTIHAIGAGVRILEFQQMSGITYRIWDWGREGRELHLEKAKLVTDDVPRLPVIRRFSEIQTGDQFFHHEDFLLKKLDAKTIQCNSFAVDVKNFKCELIDRAR